MLEQRKHMLQLLIEDIRVSSCVHCLHQDGNRVELEIREPSTHFSFGSRSVEVHLRVPRELTTEVHTGDGSIKLTGLHGFTRVNTGDGSVQADDLDGRLDARSGDGSLHIRGRFDDLKIRTSDGSVDVQAGRGSRMQADWRVETGDGSVHLEVPTRLGGECAAADWGTVASTPICRSRSRGIDESTSWKAN